MADLVKSIAVIIVNYRTPDLVIASVAALADARLTIPGLRVIVVDGGSDDGSAEQLAQSIADNKQEAWVTALPLALNGGFAYANNRALVALTQSGTAPAAIALINPDARVRPGALEAMAALLDREPKAGAIGARLEHEDGRPQASAFHFPSLRSEFCRGARTRVLERLLRQPQSRIDADAACQVPWVTGAAVMFRTSALQAVGFFDEGFFLYFEETDLMRRLRAGGWQVWHEPAARVVHKGGAATQIRDPETGLPKVQRLPRYWYQSRRRYFALAGGSGYALAAGMAWLAGHLLWQARRIVSRAHDAGPLRGMGDLVEYGLWPRPVDSTAAGLPFGAPAPQQPAWMKAAR
jgi:N-acetylglucosaminyl-diphospho-decaprenol L-rhamnosyltransferase